MNLEIEELYYEEESDFEETALKYSYEDILNMLMGYEYYSENQIKYIYYNCNGFTKQAEKYLKLCKKEASKLEKEVSKLMPKEELEKIEKEVKEVKEESIENNIIDHNNLYP